MAVYILPQSLLLGLLIYYGMNSPWWLPYPLLFIPIGLTAWVIYWMTSRNRHYGDIAFALAFQTFWAIVFFAAAFRSAGLSGYPPPINWDVALYFSIVTWTTLGYGDIHPESGFQLLAGFEALLGYFYLGLLVALVSRVFK